jgi:glycosyltransferase involved in cell wall biosynthesis
MLRILYIAMDVNFPDYYGGAKRAYETARMFLNKGHEVSILVFRKPGEPAYEFYQGIHIYRASIFDLRLFLEKYFNLSGVIRKFKGISKPGQQHQKSQKSYADYYKPKQLKGIKDKLVDLYRHRLPLHKYIRNLSASLLMWKILKQRKIDIVIERGPSYGTGALVSKLTGRVYIVDFIDIMYSNWSLKLADLILSYFTTVQIPAFVPRNKIVKVYTAADENKFKPMPKSGDLLKKYNIGTDGFVLIYSGAMYHWHGLDTMIETMRILKEKGFNDIKLFLVGDGEARPSIESLVKRYSLQSSIIFTGKVPFDEVPKYLSIADVALSLNTGDSIGFKLIEYMAAAKAIITTNVDVVHTIADNGKDILFVPVNDPHAVVDSVLLLKKDKALRMQFEQNVRNKFLKNLTWNAHYHNICLGIKKILKEKQGIA